MFPHARLVFREINRRYEPILGRLITPSELYGVLRNLGDTPPSALFEYLEREGYGVLGIRRNYAHFPDLVRRFAILERADREPKAAGGAV